LKILIEFVFWMVRDVKPSKGWVTHG
jgi:hypothetical protein